MEESLIEKEIKQEDKPEIKGKITEKAKKAIIWFIIINIILTGAIFFLYQNQSDKIAYNANEIVMFSKPDCPHCKLVKEFISENNLTSKLNITFKEAVSPVIIQEYSQIADFCKIAPENRGVPLLFYDKQCYLGDKDSIDLLKKLGGIK